MSDLVVTVTEDDIRLGDQGDPESCAIALAASRALNSHVSVGYTWVFDMDRDITYDMTPEMRWFVTKFDEGEEVFPRTFEVNKAILPALES